MYIVNHSPRKRFGQNFLQDQTIIQKILMAFNLQKNDNVVEIGPGLGALTQPLLNQLAHLTAVEIDRDLQRYLNELFINKSLDIIGADALTVNYAQLGDNLRVIGNLPYNISTPLILHLLKFTAQIQDMHFMLQKEMVDRLVGQPGSRDYGRLSIMVQYHCYTEQLFDVPPDAFHPQPKVNSAIIRLIPYKKSPYSTVEISLLQSVVAKAFSMRRKTLANNLKGLFTAEQLSSLNIDPTLRPEQIPIEDFVKLANVISSNKEWII